MKRQRWKFGVKTLNEFSLNLYILLLLYSIPGILIASLGTVQ